MKFNIFTLHPGIFTSFIGNSLIARAIDKKIIEINTIDWRQDFGIGAYRQVDDKPFGGGSGMVLMADPIINCMIDQNCFSNIDTQVLDSHKTHLPNNARFYEDINSGKIKSKKVNILMTPRGFALNQKTVEWLVQDFDEINILCGRYEGFDARINQYLDLELSIGDFVLNGGEVGSMCLVEAVSRLVPEFITKNTSVLHDSFSSGLNNYSEFEFDNSKSQYKKQLEKNKKIASNLNPKATNLFDNQYWKDQVLPFIEHPQYTRPHIWNEKITNLPKKIPEVLVSGDHAKIQKWRIKWW